MPPRPRDDTAPVPAVMVPVLVSVRHRTAVDDGSTAEAGAGYAGLPGQAASASPAPPGPAAAASAYPNRAGGREHRPPPCAT